MPASRASRAWRDRNPTWTYVFFDDAACVAFLTEHLGERVALAFQTLRPGAFKADLFRYAFLYVRGGVYVDLDMMPGTTDLTTLVEATPEADLISCRERQGIRGVWQGFMACVPRLSVLRDAVDMIVHHVEHRVYPVPEDRESGVPFWEPILAISGPALLATALSRHAGGRYDFLQLGDQRVGETRLHLYRFDDHVWGHDGAVLVSGEGSDYAPHDSYAPLVLARRVYGEA